MGLVMGTLFCLQEVLGRLAGKNLVKKFSANELVPRDLEEAHRVLLAWCSNALHNHFHL